MVRLVTEIKIVRWPMFFYCADDNSDRSEEVEKRKKMRRENYGEN